MAVQAVKVPFGQAFGRSKILSWILTTDHKRVGILYLITAFFFFGVGGIEALLIRLQLAQPNARVLGPDEYNQIFTMHGTTMIFLAVMPLSIGFANYILPLMPVSYTHLRAHETRHDLV